MATTVLNMNNAPSGTVGDPRQKSELPPFAPYNSLSTMAPSKADILQALTNFFGNPAQPEKLVNFSDHHAATYQLPDAFLGQSTLLRDTINNLLVSSPQNWQTSIALPFLRINTMTVSWDKIGTPQAAPRPLVCRKPRATPPHALSAVRLAPAADFDVRVLQRIPVCLRPQALDGG
jgi:hypothetical protein